MDADAISIGLPALETWQKRFVRWMMALSIVLHGGVMVVGASVSALFPAVPTFPVVTVELTEAPLSELPPDEPAPPSLAPAEPPRGGPAAARDAPAPKPAAARPPSADRWLAKLDAGLSRIPEAPVAKGTGRPGGIPVRRWETGAPPAPGDFAPAVAPEKGFALKKELDELESRLRSAPRPAIGGGGEIEASVMFGGVGDRTGEPVPEWVREMIRRKVRGYLAELEASYSAAFRRNPDLRGRLIVRFRIDPSGRIQSADAVQSSFDDRAFIEGVLGKVRRWTFDPTAGRTVDVLYPFVFVAPS